MKKKFLIGFLSFVLLLFLFFPQTTFLGAKNGLSLWLFTIIPTLLPFMIITNILVQINGDEYISSLLSPVTKRLLHISTSANYALIIGILCGYPMGAKAVSDLVSHNKITRKEGQYLLCFCNNASPMFIISFICYSSLGSIKFLPYILLPIYASMFICCFLFKLWTDKKETITKTATKSSNMHFSFQVMDHSILSTFESLDRKSVV